MTESRGPGRPRQYFPLSEPNIRQMIEAKTFLPGVRQKPPFTNKGISFNGSLFLIPPDDYRWTQRGRYPLRQIGALDFLTRIRAKGLVVVGTADLKKCRISYDPRLPRPKKSYRRSRWRKRK